MSERERDERLRAAFAAPLSIAAGGEGCPPAERLWDAAHGKLDRGAAEALLLHCGECGACAEGWRLARLAVPPRRITRRLVAAAAAVAFVGLAAWLIPKLVPPPAPVWREADLNAIRSTVGTAPLSRDDCVLSWTAGPEAARYDVRVFDEHLDLRHTAWDLDEPRARVPPEALDSLPSGSRILWQVTVRSAVGESETSDTFAAVVE